MTCIVGLTDGGSVYIGGDSAGVNGLDLMVRTDRKVFRNGPFVFGFTSSFRMGQLLQYSFKPPHHEEGVETEQYLAATFIDAVRQCLKDGGYASKENETESGGTFLIGYRGGLYFVGDDYQIGMTACGFNAVGCGESFAKGSLFSSQGMEPMARVKLALRAAEEFSAGVRGPFHVEVLGA